MLLPGRAIQSTRTWSHHKSTSSALPFHPKCRCCLRKIVWTQNLKTDSVKWWRNRRFENTQHVRQLTWHLNLSTYLYVLSIYRFAWFHIWTFLGSLPSPIPTGHLLYTSRLACRFGFVQGMKAMDAIFMHWPQLKRQNLSKSWGRISIRFKLMWDWTHRLWVRNALTLWKVYHGQSKIDTLEL